MIEHTNGSGTVAMPSGKDEIDFPTSNGRLKLKVAKDSHDEMMFKLCSKGIEASFHAVSFSVRDFAEVAFRILRSPWAIELSPNQSVPELKLLQADAPQERIAEQKTRLAVIQAARGIEVLPPEQRSFLERATPLKYGEIEFYAIDKDAGVWAFRNSSSDRFHVPGRVLIDVACRVLRDPLMEKINPLRHIDFLPSYKPAVWFGSGYFDSEAARTLGFEGQGFGGERSLSKESFEGSAAMAASETGSVSMEYIRQVVQHALETREGEIIATIDDELNRRKEQLESYIEQRLGRLEAARVTHRDSVAAESQVVDNKIQAWRDEMAAAKEHLQARIRWLEDLNGLSHPGAEPAPTTEPAPIDDPQAFLAALFDPKRLSKK